MNTPPALLLIAAGFVLAALAGCSNNAAPAKAEGFAKMARGTSPGVDSVCDRQILKAEDVGGIFSTPITGTKPLPGDAQSCEFTTTTFPALIVSVRPGLGRTTVDAWATGKMPVASSPLTDVGDAAVWVETLHEVVEQKNAILCDIPVRGGGSDLALSDQALAAATGALCNTIFAAY